jgi:hypothetical protein
MSSLSQLSLNNTERVICDSIFLKSQNTIIDIYDIFLTQADASTLIGFDSTTVTILQEIVNSIGGNSSTWWQDLWNAINLKANIIDVYNKTYIDTLISNYYTKIY